MVARKVEFIARDPQRQDIGWVRVTDADGNVREFSNEDDPLTDEDRESLEVHTIECLDCHSRPAHQFKSPVDSVNAALADGRISTKTPYVKPASVLALDGGYETTPDALAEIGARFRSFYEDEYPEALDGDSKKLDDTIAVLKDIYQRTDLSGNEGRLVGAPEQHRAHRITRLLPLSQRRDGGRRGRGDLHGLQQVSRHPRAGGGRRRAESELR